MAGKTLVYRSLEMVECCFIFPSGVSRVTIHYQNIYSFQPTSNKFSIFFPFAAIKSLDTLNDQIVQYLFSPKAAEIDFDNDLSAKDKETLQSSMTLMRQLLQVSKIKVFYHEFKGNG